MGIYNFFNNILEKLVAPAEPVLEVVVVIPRKCVESLPRICLSISYRCCGSAVKNDRESTVIPSGGGWGVWGVEEKRLDYACHNTTTTTTATTTNSSFSD